MTCRAPLEASWNRDTQKRPTVWRKGRRPKTLAEGYAALELPCGQCAGCRLEKSRVWAMRMTHEAALWEELFNRYSIFLTLTYDDENLPYGGTLVKHDIQKFFKRLWWQMDGPLRYYVVGEYGTQCPYHEIIDCPQCGSLQRPHYHAIIFGWTPPDQQIIGHRDGGPVYESEIIKKTWKLGLHEFGSCTFESAAYVARYNMKKITGDEYKVADHYCKYIWQTDTWIDLEPEFAMMSKRPGIGRWWFDKYYEDIYSTDEVPIPGRTSFGKPGKYYDSLYQNINPTRMEEIKEERRKTVATSLVNGPSLESKIICQEQRLKRYARS